MNKFSKLVSRIDNFSEQTVDITIKVPLNVIRKIEKEADKVSDDERDDVILEGIELHILNDTNGDIKDIDDQLLEQFKKYTSKYYNVIRRYLI